MANLDDLFQKTITGQYLEMDTLPLGNPINSQSLSLLDAPASSCTITADIDQTWGGITYVSGDIMFTSDAYTIYDSLGNTINGWTAGSTGAHRAAPQGVSFVRVPDICVTANGGLAADKGRFFWTFFNSLKFGIRVGVIDMTGNGGRGTFTGYASLGADGTNTLGEVGTLKNTIEGTCGRMETICVLDGATEEEQGVIILSKSFTTSGSNNSWNMHKITKISNVATGTAPGCPLLSSGTSDGVIQVYGYPTAQNDAGKNGIVRSTRKPYLIAGPSFQKVKVASIFVDDVGVSASHVNIAKCNIMNLDTVNLVLSDTIQFAISQADNGVHVFPAPTNYPSRYFAKWLEWSHKSSANLGYLYIPNFNAGVSNGDLDINWQSYGATNTQINNGSVSVHENGGAKIWGGNTAAGRVIAGLWADPSQENRIFIHTPQVTGLSTSIASSSDIFSHNYPEQWGTLAGNWGNIQHCILSNTDDPVNTTLTQAMVGTLNNNTQYRYGAPAHHYCMINPPIVTTNSFIEACGFAHTYSIDLNLSLWESTYTAGMQTSMREVTQFPTFTNLIDAAADAYTGQIWLYHGTGVTLYYNHYNIDTNLLSTQTAVTSDAALATYSDFIAFATPSIVGSTSVGAKDPRTDICMFTWFIGRKAGSPNKYSIGKLNRNTGVVHSYNIALELDTSVALSSGVPISMAVTDNIESTAAFVYFVVGKKVIEVNVAATTVTILGAPNAGLPTNFTAISWDITGLILRGWSGVAGSQDIYDINVNTGVTSNPIPAQTLPGNYPWAVTSNIAFLEYHAQYWGIAPLNATDVQLPGLASNLCKNGLVWRWTNTGNNSPIGCYKCTTINTTFHDYTTMCPQQDIGQILQNCRYCANQPVFDDCRGFIPCCYPLLNGGPVLMPGVSIDPNVVPGNTYSAQAGTNPAVCATAFDIPPLFWMSMDNDLTVIQIDDVITGATSIQTLVSPSNADTQDIAFDKHGNVLITNNLTDIVWGAALPGYSTTLDVLSTTFPTPKALDTDYSINNYIVSADNVAGVATFNTFDHLTVFGTLTLAGTVTNTTISIGHDISCDPSTGDWWLLGDVTGGTSSNDLLVIDNATGNHALQGDLTAILSLGAGEVVRGIEAVEFILALTTLYVVVSKPISGTTTFNIFLYKVENSIQVGGAVGLIEPVSGTTIWDSVPTGLAYNDVCQKWANNIQPNLVEYGDCVACLNNSQTADCCFKCTDCTDPSNFFYSTSPALLPYTTSANLIWRDGNDVCWETEFSQACINPIVATIAAGPFTDCNDCAVATVECFKLTSCIDATDILYTNTTVDPAIIGFLGQTIHITGECFCRTVDLETCPVAAVLYTYTTFSNCAHCIYYLRVEDCITGIITFVDYATSPTLWPHIGSANAFNIVIGGLGQVNCHKILVGCQGPGSFTYPAASVGAPFADCITCANNNLVCVQATWCCDPAVIITVYVTSGITAADNGLVVEADITILGVIHQGCWEIVSTGIQCSSTTILDVDVNAISTSTVGNGAVATCNDCVNSPCNDPCVLLNPCDVTLPNITVSGAQGVAIGTSVVNFTGILGCYYVCSANLTHGTNWFWGAGQGINFTGGVAALDFSGQSNMTTALGTGDTKYCWRSSCVHSSTKVVTFGAVTYAAGDLMFYSDGKYIYDSTHTLMTDQTGTVLAPGVPLLLGGSSTNTNVQSLSSASQQCIVVPAPIGGKTNGVFNQYYLFYQTIKDGPLYSCIIDMTLNAGKGQVITASKNNVVAASSCEGLATTNSQAITEEWFVYDFPVMTNCLDYANAHIRGRKIDVSGIGASFVAGDISAMLGFWGKSSQDPLGDKSMAQIRIKVDYQNKQVGVLCHSQASSTATGCTPAPWTSYNLFVVSLDIVTGTMTGPGGTQKTNGYNGGAYNGAWSLVSNVYIGGDNFSHDFEFNSTGTVAYIIYGGANTGPGWGPSCCENCAYMDRYYLVDAYINNVANQNVGLLSGSWLCELPGQPANSANVIGDSLQGWDMQLAPDGKIYIVANQSFANTTTWTEQSGNTLNNTSLLVIEDPDDINVMTPAASLLNGGLTAFDLGSRHIGTGLPTYLSAACGCDPVDITTPVVSNTMISCADQLCLSNPQTGCYELTECECTGGTGFNSCAVNDPNTMPANMITYGKSWSAVCDFGVAQRWPALVTAIQNLGTTASPGIAQTITFSFSFIQAASDLVSLMGNSVGPTVAVEQLAGAMGSGPACAPYPKTYVQSHAQWSTEIDSMFNEIKLLFEGMFSTSCGYGADLTVNFTNLGYESGASSFAGVTMAAGNGVSFTDSNGISNIGDFRIGQMDYGTIFCGCTQGCKNGVLAACLSADLNSCDPGLVKSVPWAGTLLFDVNEDWRADTIPAQTVVADSYSIKRTGIHEILHAFGFGHDFFTFGGVGPAGDCTALCTCPCYQSGSTCPGLNLCETFPGSGVIVQCCPGITPNNVALMGPFATIQRFDTDFPTGLLGAEGIYDRRATCGIYGNPSANFGCEDGTCLVGCNYVIEYSDDPDLSAYLGGVIVWDNGDAAGERCWEVEWISPIPPSAVLINPVAVVSGSSLLTCTDCTTQGTSCYELILCTCNTVSGAPASIITNTDMSLYCNFTPPATTIEIAAYPGACYSIVCTPIGCQGAGIPVVVTNTYLDCQDCCDVSTTCYELCPCIGGASGGSPSQDCSAKFHMTPGTQYTGINWLNYFTTNANGFTGTDLRTIKYESSQGNLTPCNNDVTQNCGGDGATQGSGEFVTGEHFMAFDWGGQVAGYSAIYYYTWDSLLADAVANGHALAGMNRSQITSYGPYQAAYTATGLQIGSDVEPCCCAGTTCTTVTTDLSGEIGQVITLGPVPPAPLVEGDCYLVSECGLCNQAGGACTPMGAVTIATGPFADCTACDDVTACTCYLLRDCADPAITITNVCASTDLDNGYINGTIIQINGNTTNCYTIECDNTSACNPAGCTSVTVTNTFASCSLCLGAQMWECDPQGGCNCTVSAGAGYPSEALCLASQGCCPSVIEYECEPLTCNCVPCLSGSCPTYNVGPTSADNLAACLADTTGCCTNTPVTYDCNYAVASNSFTCDDPGNGTGEFFGATALADCNACVSSNCTSCQVESWDCITTLGVSTCVDPGTGSGAFNNTNGGLAACIGCVGCPLAPGCLGTTVSFDCDPIYGCIQNWFGTGQYPDIATCATSCSSYDPGPGDFEGDCVNCFTELEMKSLLEKVSGICQECDVPYGLTEQEVDCEQDSCFGDSNIYFMLDVTSTFGGGLLAKLQGILDFKTNVLVPAFQQLQADNPGYGGHMYILAGACATALYGTCNNCNNTGGNAPGSAESAEQWLQWAQYPLSGNKGANGVGAIPFNFGTLPAAQRAVLAHTMVDGIGGLPFTCNGGAWDSTTHGVLLEQILVLPGSYPSDGFTQKNPWLDVGAKAGFSDPYHEFEGGDNTSVVIIFQDEATVSYMSAKASTPPSLNPAANPVGTCGNPLWNNVPATTWNSLGMRWGNQLTDYWKTDYHNYMSLHQYGWDASGVANALSASYNVTQKVFMYGGSYITPGDSSTYHPHRYDFHYHLYACIGGDKGMVSSSGHISCADYVPVPAVFGHQCYAATDVSIPNPYMGNLGGGDPLLTTGYKGGSLSEYDFRFFIPDFPIQQLQSQDLLILMETYLSDCEVD